MYSRCISGDRAKKLTEVIPLHLVVYVLSNQMSLVDKVETGSWIF